MVTFLKFSIPEDQAYFILVQILSLAYAFIFRQILLYQLSNSPSSKTTIYLLSFVPGLIFYYICFGNKIFHLILFVFISYLLLLLDAKRIHLITFLSAMAYLSLIHLYRLFYDYSGTYKMDISAPMMILVEKVTSVAFSFHDGILLKSKREFELSSKQKQYCIQKKPSFLEYCAYMFNFQTFCGPLIFYVDYHNYLNGNKLKKYEIKNFPSVTKFSLKQLLICAICAIFILQLAPLYPISYLQDEHFYRTNFLHKLLIIYLVSLCARFKYYFAWKLSECICNVSGLGFNGLEPKTYQPKYDLATNIHIYDFEMSLSQRGSISAWNITTVKWLRAIAYDRTPKRYKLITTFILSAFWHGFFPGYYLTFLTAGLFTIASRSVRKCLRYRFTRSIQWLMFYHFLTWLTTRLMISYCSFPFVLLGFFASVQVYQSLFWFGHLLALFGWLILPNILKPEAKMSTTKKHEQCLENGHNQDIKIVNSHSKSL